MQPQYLPVEAQVELLRRQFLQLVDPRQLPLPAPNTLKASEVQSQIYKTMFRPGCIAFPPPASYRLRVLKRIMAIIEHAISDPDEDEISDDLSTCLAELMTEPSVDPTTLARQKHYVTYTLPGLLAVEELEADQRASQSEQQEQRRFEQLLSTYDRQTPLSSVHPDAPNSLTTPRSITLLGSQDVLAAAGTTGRRTWEAALWLGLYLVSSEGRKFVEGKTILELGAGTGFLAVLCARHLNAHFVLTTDGSGEVIDDLGVNLYLNGLDGSEKIETAVLKWGHAMIDEMLNGKEDHRRYDIVLGSDLIYDHNSVRPLVSTTKQMLERDRGTLALISATVRNEATLKLFEETCREQAMSVQILPVPEVAPTEQTGFFNRLATPIRVYIINLL